jgi:membrane-bound metal-dependent hydrolase YbcI (DUF457 family)
MKPIYQSKTFWVNLLSLVAYVVAFPQINAIIPAQYAGVILTVVNIILRYFTNQGVTLT